MGAAGATTGATENTAGASGSASSGSTGGSGGAAGADVSHEMDSSTAGSGGAAASIDAGVTVIDPGNDGDGKITVTNMTRQPELTSQGNPVGKEFTFKLTSMSYQYTEPTIAAGSPKNQPRNVWVYVPKEYQDGTEAPLMIIQDGQQGSGTGGRYGSIKFALDNLTISKDPTRKIPAFIAIAVQNGGNDGKNSERGLEYDTMSDRYARFIQDEVLPAVLSQRRRSRPPFPTSPSPTIRRARRRIGCSSGGAAALTMAWFRPGPLPPRDHLLRHLRGPAERDAPEHADVPARRLGIPLRA